MNRLLAIALAATLVAGCAGRGDFPSLAPRAVERLSMEEPIRVDPPVATDAALRGRGDALLADARRGEQAFEAAYARALPLARGAGAGGSDSRLAAEEAISRAEVARARTTAALAALDALLAERADEATNAGDFQALTAALAAASALAEEQQRRLVELRRQAGSR